MHFLKFFLVPLFVSVLGVTVSAATDFNGEWVGAGQNPCGSVGLTFKVEDGRITGGSMKSPVGATTSVRGTIDGAGAGTLEIGSLKRKAGFQINGDRFEANTETNCAGGHTKIEGVRKKN